MGFLHQLPYPIHVVIVLGLIVLTLSLLMAAQRQLARRRATIPDTPTPILRFAVLAILLLFQVYLLVTIPQRPRIDTLPAGANAALHQRGMERIGTAPAVAPTTAPNTNAARAQERAALEEGTKRTFEALPDAR